MSHQSLSHETKQIQMQIPAEQSPIQQLFTCLTCGIGFKSAENQRNHMKSDWHRYNLKRKVLSLPPLTAFQFNDKILEIQKQEIEKIDQGNWEGNCLICKKSYASQGQLESHLSSKKHLELVKKDKEARLKKINNQKKTKNVSAKVPEQEEDDQDDMDDSMDTTEQDRLIYTTTTTTHPASSTATSQLSATGFTASSVSQAGNEDEDEDRFSSASAQQKKSSFRVRLGQAQTEQQVQELLDEKIACTTRLSPQHCLFCTASPFSAVEECVEHMAAHHGFFIPDIEFLSDLEGLLQYLSDKIVLGNCCLYCNGKGRAFYSLESVRAHMVSKGHCKIPFEDGDEDETAEFYEYGGSDEDDEWEDDEDDNTDDEEDEEIDEEFSQADFANKKNKSAVVFEDAQLRLPSGIKIGHRAFRRYWRQNLRPTAPSLPAWQTTRHRLESGYKSLQLGQARVPLSNTGGGALILATREERLAVKVEKREARRRLGREFEHRNRVGVKHNMLQHHYREQNPF